MLLEKIPIDQKSQQCLLSTAYICIQDGPFCQCQSLVFYKCHSNKFHLTKRHNSAQHYLHWNPRWRYRQCQSSVFHNYHSNKFNLTKSHNSAQLSLHLNLMRHFCHCWPQIIFYYKIVPKCYLNKFNLTKRDNSAYRCLHLNPRWRC